MSAAQTSEEDRARGATLPALSDPRVRAELLALVFAATPIVQFANVVNATLVFFVIGQVVGGIAVVVWYGLTLALAAVRMVAWRRYRRDDDKTGWLRRWAFVAVAGSGASGVLWGASGALMLMPDSLLHYALLVFVLGGMAAGAVTALAAYPPALVAYLVPSLLPLCIRLVVHGETVNLMMAGMVLLYGCGVYVIGRRAHAWLGHTLVLRFENAELLRTLERRVEERTEELRRVNVELQRDIEQRMRTEEALHEEKERAQVTLHSIGDGVITTDAEGVVEYLNPIAETLIGWISDEARGLSLDTVFRVIDEDSREPVPNPVARCLEAGAIAELDRSSLLVDRHGREYAIEDSAAPIRNREGRVLGAVLVFHDVSEARRMARQMEHDAAHDPLTGLINRREFERRLEHAVFSAKRYDSHHVLCYLDLDQFKLVNDTAGHAAGDELLKRVRRLLAGKFRDRDTFARLGGDEFGFLLDNCQLPEALGICDIVIATFRDYRFRWQGRSFQIGASIGVVPVNGHAESAAQLMSQADVACYTAKELGRSQVHVYQMEGARPSRRHSEIILASGLQDALEQDRFVLYCQPIVDLARCGGPARRFEVLLRLRDGGDLVPPHGFIPAAERYGLMTAIDRWVVRHAFGRCGQVFGADSDVEIAINLSGNSLGDDGLLEFLTRQFAGSSLAPHRVCFEITETSAIRDLGKAVDFLLETKKMGCRFALDDFGAGLSSFTYLKHLPADYLKIDGSFVRDMADNPIDQAMVGAINEVGHTLGMKTIAECVQSEIVVERLTAMGVDWAQGYALGVPVPFDETLTAARLH